jgi:hypothetical protein
MVGRMPGGPEPTHRWHRLLQRTVLAAWLIGALSGCVTRAYKLAPEATPPATMLNLRSAPDPASAAEATVNSVIVYQGPGSWKRYAYWDEYVVNIENRSAVPVTLTAVTLTGTKGETFSPGEDPWKLEKTTKSWWQSNGLRQTGIYLGLGGAMAAGGIGVLAAGVGEMSVGATAGAVGGAGVALMAAAPIVAGGSVYMNLHRRHQVEAEFARRRMKLPLVLPAGSVANGSLFFRITPAPRRLTIAYSLAGRAQEAVVDLTPIARLHLDP